MGLGKTLQVLDALDRAKANRVLVICPAIARGVWEKEIKKFAPHRGPVLVVKSGRVRVEDLVSNFVVMSFELASRMIPSFYGETFDTVVIDEVHYLKNPKAKRTINILGSKGIRTLRPKRFWALSGTPMPNHPGELWILATVMGVTKLTLREFQDKFCVKRPCGFSPEGYRVVGAKEDAAKELRELFSPYILRRLQKEVLEELPDMTIQTLPVEPDDSVFEEENLDKEDLALVQSQEMRVSEELKNATLSGKDAGKVLESLAAGVSSLRRYTGLRKAKSSAKLIKEELEQKAYGKIVIFCVHKSVVRLMEDALAEFNPVVITGEVTNDRRTARVERFQTDPDCRVFIGNVHAAGTAITLTAAHNVFFVEMDFVPGVNAQCESRCLRIGQKSNVFVRYAFLEESIDEQITEILARKTRDIAMIVDGKFDAPIDQIEGDMQGSDQFLLT